MHDHCGGVPYVSVLTANICNILCMLSTPITQTYVIHTVTKNNSPNVTSIFCTCNAIHYSNMLYKLDSVCDRVCI